ncbi:MAG: hypothetical protein IKL29_07180, partial [Bacteroidaceae bacterium]|nr:hypothetical protein [Bacteroidaceae bacterium]
MKRNKLFTIAASLLAVFTFTQCANNAAPTQTEVNKEATATTQGGLKIAYVDIDSLLNNYTFSVKLRNDMLRKTENAQMTLGEKAKEYYLDQGLNCAVSVLMGASDTYNLGLKLEDAKLVTAF